MAVLVLVPISLLANGIVHSNKEYTPLIVKNGCDIGLNLWYIFLTGMAILKLSVEVSRYLYIKVKF